MSKKAATYTENKRKGKSPVKKGKKKFKGYLPNRIIALPCKDKANHEKWTTGRNIANFPRPYRMINAGGVNAGKTTLCLNLILRAKPAFDNIYVVHASSTSRDYDALDIPEENYLDDIPPPSFFPEEGSPEHTLLILEDIEYRAEGKNENLSKLFRYCSTHKGVSILLNYQCLVKVPKIARRLANVFNIWKMPDRGHMSIIERKVGLDKGELKQMFEQLGDNHRTFFTFDLTANSPAPLRKDLFIPIKKVDDYEL
jgi:hypothetical protein